MGNAQETFRCHPRTGHEPSYSRGNATDRRQSGLKQGEKCFPRSAQHALDITRCIYLTGCVGSGRIRRPANQRLRHSGQLLPPKEAGRAFRADGHHFWSFMVLLSVAVSVSSNCPCSLMSLISYLPIFHYTHSCHEGNKCRWGRQTENRMKHLHVWKITGYIYQDLHRHPDIPRAASRGVSCKEAQSLILQRLWKGVCVAGNVKSPGDH